MENIKNIFNEEEKKSVLLTLTQACNLDCMYCYEANKSNRMMDFKTAKIILDKELNADDWSKYVSIDLFGGEPLLCFDTIKQIVKYLENNSFKKNYIIFIMTNGTLVHGEIKEWLINHKDKVICGLSLDGNKYMHDINRSNSFDKIDLKFFKEHYPSQDIKMTVSTATLPYLYEGVKFCHDQGFYVTCNLAYGIDWSDEKNISELENQLMLLINYYLTSPTITPASILDEDISLIGYDRKDKNRQWCGVGNQTKAYDIDGTYYPCQLFMPLSCGKEKAEVAKEIKFIYNNIPLNLLDRPCQDCAVREICSSCYGSNYIATGNIYHKDMNLCKLQKVIIKARAYFKAKQWELGQLQLSDNETIAMLKSIKIIQDNL